MPRHAPALPVGTRGKILARLCEASATAAELAKQLGISSNATRQHLRGLEERGLVAYQVVRRGVGKPSHVYDLSADASRLLSRAYIPVIHQLLSIWEQQTKPTEVLEAFQQAGRALVESRTPLPGSLSRRVEAAAAAFEELGALVRIEKHDSAWIVHGRCCPLGSLTSQHAGLCKLMESMMATVTRGAVRERCERGVRPHCVFEIRAPGEVH